MNFCQKRNCIAKICFCNQPIFLFHHMELHCCNQALYHVQCISKCKRCPHCLKEFNEEAIQNINIAQSQCIKKLKTKQALEKKKTILRNEIKHKVQWIIYNKLQQQ